MKNILLTVTLASLLGSAAALACEDSAQRDSSAASTLDVAAAAPKSLREAAAPAGKADPQARLPETPVSRQPDPRYLPYVTNGWDDN